MKYISIKNDLIFTIVLLIYCFLAIIPQYFKTIPYNVFYIMRLLDTLFILWGLVTTKRYKSITQRELILFFSITVISVFSVLYNNNRNIWGVLSYCNVFIVSVLLLRLRLNLFIIRVVYWSFALLLLFLLVINININIYNFPFNSVSVHLLIFLSLYYIALPVSKRKLFIIPTSVSFILSLLTGCRSGSIAFFIVTIGCLFNNISNGKRNIKSLLSFLLLLGLLLITCFTSVNNGMFLRINSKFNYYQTHEEPRLLIWYGVLEKANTNFFNLLFGPSFNDIPIMKDYDNNPHCAYLYAYMNFGLLFAVYIFFSIIHKIKFWYYKNIVISCLIFAMWVRSFTDITAFVGCLDFMFYFYILSPIKLMKYDNNL